MNGFYIPMYVIIQAAKLRSTPVGGWLVGLY